MEVHVSLDIYQGRVVRMAGGDPSNLKVYSEDPLAKGLEILELGIKRIHVVDLEAALSGKHISRSTLKVAGALGRVGGFVTVGGGIRSLEDMEEALGLGVDRVVVGTAIYTGSISPREALRLGGERVVVAADTRAGVVVHSGWRSTTTLSVGGALRRFHALGFRRFLVTDTGRDGSLGGVDPALLTQIEPGLRGCVIYSGGISSTRDLEALRGFGGVVVGKAFYEGLLTPKELVAFEGAGR